VRPPGKINATDACAVESITVHATQLVAFCQHEDLQEGKELENRRKKDSRIAMDDIMIVAILEHAVADLPRWFSQQSSQRR